MVDTKRLEELSFSYLNAICAIEGISVSPNRHDEDGIDVMLQKIMERKQGKINVRIAAQLKSTAQTLSENGGNISYPLKVKNYNDLRARATCPQLLLVLFLPKNKSEWLEHSIEELVIRKCMYWADLSDMPDTNNVATVTVKLPKENFLGPEVLSALFEKVAREEFS